MSTQVYDCRSNPDRYRINPTWRGFFQTVLIGSGTIVTFVLVGAALVLPWWLTSGIAIKLVVVVLGLILAFTLAQFCQLLFLVIAYRPYRWASLLFSQVQPFLALIIPVPLAILFAPTVANWLYSGDGSSAPFWLWLLVLVGLIWIFMIPVGLIQLRSGEFLLGVAKRNREKFHGVGPN